MPADHVPDDVAHLLEQLKKSYKAQGIRYHHVAATLGVCDKTMKRYMAGKGVTMAVFDKLCRIAGFTLLDLAEIVNKRREERPYASAEFEELMGRDLFTSLIFMLLRRGWDARDFPEALKVDPADINQALTKLDRLGVIKLYPENRVKVIATIRPGERTPRQRGSDAIKQAMYRNITEMIEEDDPNLVWRIAMARLTPDKLPMIGKMYDDLLEEIYALETREGSTRDATWYRMPLLAGVMPEDFTRFKPGKMG